MTFIESERTAGAQYVHDCAATLRVLWAKCCEHDRIPVDSKFVVFSDTNLFKPFYDKAASMYQEALAGFNSFGYSGLTIGKSGRAELYKRPKKAKKK